MSTYYLKTAVISAAQSFITNDSDLLRLKVYEPSVSHRIAFYLERDSFREGFHIDCEYDKRFGQEKMRSNGKPMRPDIVVHVRNQDTGNKIAIEVKKVHSSKQDVEKLKMLTLKNGPYGYQLGVFIRFPIDEPKYKWFINGEEENI